MLTITLHPRPDPVPLDLDPAGGLAPDRLAGRFVMEVLSLPVRDGNRTVPLGKIASVEGQADDRRVTLRGDWSTVDGVGAGMAGGELVVEGGVGRHAGARMTGGSLTVHGSAGGYVGAAMAGGALVVRGDAGDHAGGCYPGERRGMTGGTLMVHGSAGAWVGHRLRRGLIAVGGACGEDAAADALAGTVLLFGPAGPRAGVGVKRATVGLLAEPGPNPPPMGPAFARAAAGRPVFLRVALRLLARHGFPPALEADLERVGHVVRWTGDHLGMGRGEVLVRVA